jgi:hypothetical protein
MIDDLRCDSSQKKFGLAIKLNIAPGRLAEFRLILKAHDEVCPRRVRVFVTDISICAARPIRFFCGSVPIWGETVDDCRLEFALHKFQGKAI